MRHTIQAIPFVPVAYMQGTAGDPAEYYDEDSAWQSPFGWPDVGPEVSEAEHTFTSLPATLGDVVITLSAYADLGDADEYVVVSINDVEYGTLFTGAEGHDCTGDSIESLTIPKAIWDTLVPAGSAKITVTPEEPCAEYPKHPDGICAEDTDTRLKINLRYLTAEATGPTPGTGPTFFVWRSYTQVYDGTGNLVYLFAALVWDPIFKQHRWQVKSEPWERRFYGGAGHSPKESSDSRPGNVCTEVRVPHYWRPKLLKIVGMGDCAPI